MANHIKVANVQSILALRRIGWSYRKIAAAVGVHRETVRRYVLQAEAGSKPATNLSTGSCGGAEANAANLSAGSCGGAEPKAANLSAGNSGPRSLCEPFRDVILRKLDQGLSAQRIWQDLGAEHGFAGRYATVKRFVRHLGRASPLPFRRMECAPGQEAQIDFGPGAPVEQGGGRRKRYPVLRVVLSHSRKGYSEVLRRQSTEDFIRALENAFRAFGGVPRILIPDNLKAAVTKADWYDPELNPKILAFCRHYGCVILPAKPYTPRHKGKVEAGVKYVFSNALKGNVYQSVPQENEALQQWEASVADLRIHGTTKRQVKVLFQEERAALLPLPATAFPFFHEAQRTVHRDAHVEVDKAYYSVPPEYLGHVVWARWDAKMVRIFNGRMSLIATHLKDQPGRFRTDPRHIASEKISGVERGAGYLLRRISLIGPESYRWARTMLGRRGIEGVRVLQGLLAMTRRYPADDMEKACALALSHGAYRLQALRELLKQPTRQVELLDHHPLIRPLEFYGRYARVPLRKEDDAKDGSDNENGEFIALGATSGGQNEKGLAVTQALSAVQPPASALGSLSSGALPSGPASQSVPDAVAPFNSLLKGAPHEQQPIGRAETPPPQRHDTLPGPAAPGSPGQHAHARGIPPAHPPG
jgi:transposase